MNKPALKNFAINARKKLREDVILRASLLGVKATGIEDPLESHEDLMTFNVGLSEPHKIYEKEIEQREQLVSELKNRSKNSTYKTAFENLVEEVAYTIFNRIIAIRFMEVNNYLPDHIRILSSGKENDNTPEIMNLIFETDLTFDDKEKQFIYEKKEDASTKAIDELFQFLFIKKCNKLNETLPELFEKTNKYTELLFSASYYDTEGVIYKLIHDINEDDFNVKKNGQVEIIGWLYQYYNEEYKSEVDTYVKKGKKVTKEDLPAKTQLFTPDWIVKYMVENSLGRLWLEGHPNNKLKEQWQYYLEEAEQNTEVELKLKKLRDEYKNINPESVRLIDPCMGSGHILVYAFDLLMQIYESQGYSKKDATETILKNNIYGIDIDKRAYQLTYFALMMKGRQHSRSILTSGIKLNVCVIQDSSLISSDLIDFIANNDSDIKKSLETIKSIFTEAKEYGSLITVPKFDYEKLENRLKEIVKNSYNNLVNQIYQRETIQQVLPVFKQAKLLQQKYDVVITNPPYMGSKMMSSKLSEYVKENYPDSKSDMFAVFMEKCNQMTYKNRFYAMITMHSWMFLSSFEKLRNKIISSDTVNMAHLGARAFDEIGGEVVQATSWVERKSNFNNYQAVYLRLVDYNGEDIQKEKVLEAIGSKDCGYLYEASKDNFAKIPGMPIAYWASENIIKAFETGKRMDEIVDPRQGLATADNNRFLRLWHEVNNNKVKYDANDTEDAITSFKKWFPANKGGEKRQWYGNYDYIVNWENDGSELKNFKDERGKLRSRPQNTAYYFKEAITWGKITSGGFSIRFRSGGSIHLDAGCSAFINKGDLSSILALLSTKISDYIFKMINPTINLSEGPFGNFPVILNDNKNIVGLVSQNISISQFDWNTFETSWDFKINPLVNFSKYEDKYYELLSKNGIVFVREKVEYYSNTIEDAYKHYKEFTNSQFNQLKKNEEELNRIFIDIYGLQDELTPEVSDKDITIAKIFDTKKDIDEEIKGNKYVLTKEDVVKQFISYAVGCMFGRYSLDEEGLAYAGGEWDKTKYNSFIPDADNCIPITDRSYFKDDIVTTFTQFVKTVYGKETLEQNLNFIADALANKGDNSREVIRNYFLKDFYSDHVKKYQKRPIYWLYDSGKENGFKALIYMHRYDEQTTARVRTRYLHEIQKYYASYMDTLNVEIDNSISPHSKKVAEDIRKKIHKQMDECIVFDEKMAHLANERTATDLDDGVKVNYNKVQTDRNAKFLNILAKI